MMGDNVTADEGCCRVLLFFLFLLVRWMPIHLVLYVEMIQIVLAAGDYYGIVHPPPPPPGRVERRPPPSWT